ncbi:MAG: methyltransferase [Humidesulfovibrio sp.]|nr:methyltransferase [Humidesulfovibrio sp.]
MSDARRALFPRGLAQPLAGFRFGVDTLLLAAFAASQLKAGKTDKALAGLDLGTGCGAASIGLLLLRPELPLRLTGIDNGPEMVAAAAQNAQDLGLVELFAPQLADVESYRAPARVDFALANPPFRVPGTGRACPEANRGRARFEGPGGFAAFAACAGRNLQRGGTLFLVHLAERLPELLADLNAAGLHTRRLLPVQGRAEANPRLALLAAVRGGGTGLSLERPLVLHGPDNALTPEALAFCPHLAVNPSRTPRNPAV